MGSCKEIEKRIAYTGTWYDDVHAVHHASTMMPDLSVLGCGVVSCLVGLLYRGQRIASFSSHPPTLTCQENVDEVADRRQLLVR